MNAVVPLATTIPDIIENYNIVRYAIPYPMRGASHLDVRIITIYNQECYCSCDVCVIMDVMMMCDAER